MAKVNFKRIQNSSQIDNLPVEDGAFIVTGDGKSYVDYDNNRIPTSGTPDTEMSDTSHNTVENKVIKEYVDNNTNSLKPTLLWTNPNPNADFAAQNITLSSSDYDYYEVVFRTNLTGNLCFSTKALKGYGTQLSFNSAAISARHWVRRILYTNDTTLSSQECAKLDDAYTADNGQCVPLLIIGYKYS